MDKFHTKGFMALYRDESSGCPQIGSFWENSDNPTDVVFRDQSDTLDILDILGNPPKTHMWVIAPIVPQVLMN